MMTVCWHSGAALEFTHCSGSSTTMSSPVSRFAFLDSLRGLAAILVVVQHLFEHRGGIGGEVLAPLGPGVAGVALFFFVSGYVIPISAGPSPVPLPFMVRRVFRIYPLFLVALALAFVAGSSGLLPRWAFMAEAPPIQWLANLLLVQDFVGQQPFLGVTWTLAIELIWYGLFLAAVLRFRERAADVLDLVVPIAILSLALLSLIVESRIPLGRPLMIYAAVVGYQAARYHASQIDLQRLWRSIAVFAFVALVANLIAFGVYRHPQMTLAQSLGPWTLATLLFLTVMLAPGLRARSWLNSGLLPMLGMVSYSTYLLHPLTLGIGDLYFAGPARVPVAIALTALASVIGYHLVEKPGIVLGRRVAKWVGKPSAPAPA